MLCVSVIGRFVGQVSWFAPPAVLPNNKIAAELLPLRFLKLTLFVKVLVNQSNQV